ncbi:MAG: GAF domain-containing protein [Melioribacteraceae bacterium]|nr:GAF domain-containing protein [Melioribacteraceae bacterium]
MQLNKKNIKRLLTFSAIPILVACLIFIEETYIRISAAIILTIYVGFIIFLRDSVNNLLPNKNELDDFVEEPEFDNRTSRTNEYSSEDGEGFVILKKTPNPKYNSDNELIENPKNLGGLENMPPDYREAFHKIIEEKIPDNINQGEQFGFVIDKILHVVKFSFMAHSALFFFYNPRTKRISLDRFESASDQIAKKKFDLENDILSKIVINKEPEILTDITLNAEPDVLRYYLSPQSIKSFVGVPIFYNTEFIGILAIDSKNNDAFGVEQIFQLGRVVRVISIIVSLFEEKHSENLIDQRLRSVLSFLSLDRKYEDDADVYDGLEHAVDSLSQYDVYSLVTYNSIENKFKITKVINKTSLKYLGEGFEIDLNGTLTGKSIMTGLPVKIDDTSATDFPRFDKSEDISFDGSFLVIPLVYDEKVYGLVCLETLKKSFFSNDDVAFLKNTLKMFSFIFHTNINYQLIKGLLTVDVETKTLTKDHFVERLTVDLVKAKELEIQGAVALIKIDDFIQQDSLFEGDPYPKVLQAISGLIRDEMTPMNLLGRMDERIFAVYFFNYSAKDVFLWSEKLRIKIARKPISVVSRQTTFTVSIGVASTNNRTDVQDLLYNAELALNKAVEKGGNSVKSIN